MVDIATLGLSVRSDQVEKGAQSLDKLSGSARRAEAITKGMTVSTDRLVGALASIERAIRDVQRVMTPMGGATNRAEAAVNGLGATSGQASGQMERLSLSGANVSVSFGKVEMEATSAAAAVDRQGASAASAAASATSHARALDAEAVSADRAAAEIAQTTTALHQEKVAADGAAASMRSAAVAANQNGRAMMGASHNVGNLAAQFQDVGVSAAMGMSPMQIALQQGTQLSAVLGPMGAAGAVRGLGAAFLSIISPISLAVIAVVALVAAGLQMVDWSAAASMALNGLAAGLETIGPYAAMAAAGLALLYAPQIIGGLVGLIALLGRVSVAAVTAAVTIAAANPGAAIIIGLTAAVAAANIFRDELTQIFGFDIVGAAKDGVNAIIGAFVGGYNYVVTTWDDLPLVFSGLGKKAYNALLDELSGKTLLTIPGTDIEWKTPSLSGLRSEVTKEEEAAMNGLSATFGNAMGQDYLGDIGGAMSNAASGAADKMREIAAGMTGSLAEVEGAAKGAGSAIGSAANDNIDPWNGLRGATKAANGAMEKTNQIAQSIGSTIANTLRQGGDLWDAFKEAGLDAVAKIGEAWITSGIQQMLGGFGGGGGFFSNIFSWLGFANGAAFDRGNVIPFAAGGVVSGPTTFPMSGGRTGLMGEAGPEAVMPLKRGRDGRLGVAASNQNQPAPNVVRIEQHYHITGAVSSDDVQRMVRRGAEESVSVVKESLPGWQTDIQLYGRPT